MLCIRLLFKYLFDYNIHHDDCFCFCQKKANASQTENCKATEFPTEPRAPSKLRRYRPEFMQYGFFCGARKQQFVGQNLKRLRTTGRMHFDLTFQLFGLPVPDHSPSPAGPACLARSPSLTDYLILTSALTAYQVNDWLVSTALPLSPASLSPHLCVGKCYTHCSFSL